MTIGIPSHFPALCFTVAATLLFGVAAYADALPAPVTDADYAPVNHSVVPLGRHLFYDPVLSGNRNIACATCHHPRFGTADGVALSLGEGGVGLGPERHADPDNLPEQRIPRNAPGLFNLGAREFTVLFHDGRIEVDPDRPGGLRTPLDAEMVAGFDNLLSAQTMFPVLSQDEMAGHYSENDVSRAVRMGRITGDGGAWDLIASRVWDIDAYQTGFAKADPEIAAGRPLEFTDISNAIAAFMAEEWRSDDSTFDRHLRGETTLPDMAERGKVLFFGAAGCADCHSGPFQTDHAFHAMGVPQFGPGKAARFESHRRDTGRERVTGNPEDAYTFRTPSLRNVEHTGPYGHTGAYAELTEFIAAHADPVASLANFDPSTVELSNLPEEDPWEAMRDQNEMDRISAAVSVHPVPLNSTEIADLVAFLKTLSDPVALQGRLGIPETVPSGLPVER